MQPRVFGPNDSSRRGQDSRRRLGIRPNHIKRADVGCPGVERPLNNPRIRTAGQIPRAPPMLDSSAPSNDGMRPAVVEQSAANRSRDQLLSCLRESGRQISNHVPQMTGWNN